MGVIEELVIRAWGLGARIDAADKNDPDAQAKSLVAVLDEARRLQKALAYTVRADALCGK